MKIAILTMLLVLGDGGEVFKFDGGAEVRGRVVKETPDTVFVDLGFTVMPVPKKHVRERVKIEPKDESAAGEEKRSIYYVRDLPRAPIQDLARRFGPAVVLVKTPSGLGSGFIIDDREGYVVTNFHVIEQETKITVTLFKQAGTEFQNVEFEKVKIVAISPFFDLALLKIEKFEPGALSRVYLGDINTLNRGDKVFAIGNPLGLSRSVTEGIVSTRYREQRGKVTLPLGPGEPELEALKSVLP